jgi:CRISPR-associated protein Csm1
MGTLIAAGFKRMTISRLASLSFEFEYFFSIKLDEIAGNFYGSIKRNIDGAKSDYAKKHGDTTNIYIVYSGGDDVSAIGEINDITMFIKNFHEGFEKYFHNGYITISCGLSISQPKFPIRRGIINAEKNLDLAKQEPNKNSIHYIDTMGWKTFIELSEFGNRLSEKINEKKLSKGFPYFLNGLGNHFNRKIIKGTVISSNINSKNSVLIPDPLVNYYIKRNYRKNNAQDIMERDSLISEILADNDEKWKYMNFLSSYVVINLRNNIYKNGE